ncbi:MAG: hypothetical protein EZS28_008403 [Streblomastix strix]|uniref:Uncharacterized protein n=1 Tax=Streblomastix strix TaxID=222440 RepID=A0A5J4WN90_9EUKA|nr:MAG: hypothetical protein EZS28_008403 [Streblomastix strix]
MCLIALSAISSGVKNKIEEVAHIILVGIGIYGFRDNYQDQDEEEEEDEEQDEEDDDQGKDQEEDQDDKDNLIVRSGFDQSLMDFPIYFGLLL